MRNLKNVSHSEALNDWPVFLEAVYSLHQAGDHESANVMLDDFIQKTRGENEFKSIPPMLKIIGHYYQGDLKTPHYEELKSLHESILKTESPLYCGWSHFLQGYFLKHEDLLSKAIKFFKQGDLHQEMTEVYYWMDKFRCLPMDEKVHGFVRLYPVNSIFSFLLGNNYYANSILPKTELERSQLNNYDHEEENFNCWLLKNKSFIPSHYNQIELRDENFIDLYSGLISDRSEYTYLLISELNCLSFLIASQLVGASLHSLAEFLDRTIEEAKACVDSLIKMGIPIEAHNELFQLNWADKPTIIIPRTLKVLGLQEFVRKTKPIFTKAQLIEHLQLTQFGAEALLKKWSLAGLIQPTETPDKIIVWRFI